jgi:hypothetical protein
MTAQDRHWRAQDALRTLTAAEAIRRDPAFMRNVKREAITQTKVLTSADAFPRPA